MNESSNVVEIDLVKIAISLFQKWWLLVISVIFGVAIVFAYTAVMISPTYQASVLMYVYNRSTSLSSAVSSVISSGDLSSARSLVSTYAVILKTRLTLEEVIKEGEYPYTYEEIKNMITAASEDNTEIFRITVTSHNAAEARDIANTVAEVLPTKITNIMGTCSVSVVDYAVVPSEPSGPNYTTIGLIGGIVGFIICSAVIILIEYFNDTLESSDWLIKNFNNEYPLLATLPNSEIEYSTNKYYSRYYSKKYYRDHDYR